ncbi:MAG: CAAX prenyl protease-related protein [Bryobacterales bacterium]|nr:CAAX prenyl protease-related protein [Bryobacterales bacterium]
MNQPNDGVRAALPYVAPMAIFMGMLWLGPKLGLGPWEFPLRVAILAAAVWFFSRDVLDLRATTWLGSIGVGVAVFLIWIGPDALIPGYRSHWIFQNSITGKVATSIDTALLTSPMVLVFRIIRAVILVPIIEELFWRGWLLRWLVKNDFQQVPTGAYTPSAVIITALLFASEHGPYWEVGLIAGLIYNWWVIRTRSLADCIVAHAVTNAALCGYVLATGKWEYWL